MGHSRGLLEIGDTFESTVKREVEEETGLMLRDLQLFGIYSGEKGYATYENGDRVFSLQIIFCTKGFEGKLTINHESQKQRFFSKEEIFEEKLNPHQAPFIKDWISGSAPPFIR
ncbi:NUDIX domain-containing protein [Halobacillus dabanensis]|uniref:NUDIX domain-containing protein n=1 Tax=Halobacillus dabanensis TaxID=240302 RepID=A0A1I3TWD8_HALDA|nr:NUDIX domain-containing protein [Halobacillus dabanensis]